MDANELLNLKRPLTTMELAFLEEEVLKLARELQKEVDTITANLDPNDPNVRAARAAAARTLENVEAAIAIPAVPIISPRTRSLPEAD